MFRCRLPKPAIDETEKIISAFTPLSEIDLPGKARSEWMREAYREHGYTMQEIAKHAGLHHSTVSRLINEGDENTRNKT